MPVTSMVRLARVNFANTDPGLLRAAVKLPRAVRPRPHGVALRIDVKLPRGHAAVEEFKLREVSTPMMFSRCSLSSMPAPTSSRFGSIPERRRGSPPFAMA
jgi:hypothetical protein